MTQQNVKNAKKFTATRKVKYTNIAWPIMMGYVKLLLMLLAIYGELQQTGVLNKFK